MGHNPPSSGAEQSARCVRYTRQRRHFGRRHIGGFGALNSLGEAILYSVDSIITRGASGLMLESHWRLPGALKATDGMLLFGISTAYIFTGMQACWAVMIRPHLPAGGGVTAGRLGRLDKLIGPPEALG
jgi:hypothetical protein